MNRSLVNSLWTATLVLLLGCGGGNGQPSGRRTCSGSFTFDGGVIDWSSDGGGVVLAFSEDGLMWSISGRTCGTLVAPLESRVPCFTPLSDGGAVFSGCQ